MRSEDKVKRQRRLSAVLLLLVVGVVTVFAALRVFERLQPMSPPPAPVLAVETLRLAPAAFTVSRRYTGSVVAVNRVMLPGRVNARVLTVHSREGDAVEQGDVLVTLDDVELEAETQRLEAASVRIQAELTFWHKQLKRDRRLLEQNTISQKQRDESLRMVNTLQASLDENSYSREIARARLGYSKVYAPFSGRIQQVMIEAGDQAAPGKALLELVSTQSLKAVVTVPQKDLGLLHTGMEVLLQPTSQQAHGWRSSLEKIYPALDRSTRNATFEAPIPPDAQHLLPGMGLRAVVTVARDDAALAIPQQALLHRRNGAGVFIVEEGVARWRDLETGARQGGLVRVLSGVTTGDEVIITPDPGLQDGAEVSVPAEGSSR